jgi:hypothetical protein
VRRAALLLAALALLLPAGASASPLEDALRRVRAIQERIVEEDGQLDLDSERWVRSELRELESDLAATPFRELPGKIRERMRPSSLSPGEPLPPGAHRLRGDLRELESRLDSYWAEAYSRPPRDVPPSRDRWHARLDEVLAQPEFDWRRRRENPFVAWLEHTWDRLVAFAKEGYRWVTRRLPQDPALGPVGWLVALSLLLFLVAGGLWIVWRLRRLRRLRLARRAPELDDEPAGPRVVTLEEPDLYARLSREAAGRGELRDAVRYRFLYLIATLERKGIVPRNRAQTNGEYLDAVSRGVDTPGAAEGMDLVTRTFDSTWYGGRACRDEAWDGFREATDVVARAGTGEGE